MKSLAPSLKPISSPGSFQKHLPMYALAASAAGVSILALAQPGEAEIIYTRAHDVRTPFNLDLNGDGIIDFTVRSSASQSSNFLRVAAAYTGNGVVGGNSYAFALSVGAQIGPSANFLGSAVMAWGEAEGTGRSFEWQCFGPWRNVKKRYLGLRFMISGELHYGWAELNETCHKAINSAKLISYAYETIPDKSIAAGQKKEAPEDESWAEPDQPAPPSTRASTPATLGMLARGAQALDIWRQE